jgi:hypothetical protein
MGGVQLGGTDGYFGKRGDNEHWRDTFRSQLARRMSRHSSFRPGHPWRGKRNTVLPREPGLSGILLNFSLQVIPQLLVQLRLDLPTRK